MKVRIKRLGEDVTLPSYETKGSVGFDIQASADIAIAPKAIALIPTGLVVETPPGYMLVMASRSSTPKKHGLTMPHGMGIIDQDYSGDEDELKIQVYNFTDEEVVVKKGARIAQGVFVRVDQATWDEQQTMGASRGGFGSTG